MKILSHSSNETKKFAKLLAKKILAKPFDFSSALIIGLTGDLGSGKTTFIQGFCKGVGIKKRITSPTFVLIKNYELRIMNYERIYHIDCYRIQKPKELFKLGLKEIVGNPQNIALIEWAEKLKKILPKKNVIWLKLKYGGKENERKIIIKSNLKSKISNLQFKI